MNKNSKKIMRMILGYFLVILGVIGIVFPILPRLIFLIPGIAILAEYVPWAKKIDTKFKQLFKLKTT